MQLSTPVASPVLPRISQADTIVALGSCFGVAMGRRLQRAGFDVAGGQFGTLFNPESIRLTIAQALDGMVPTPQEFYEQDGLYVHTGYHSLLARGSVEEAQGSIELANAGLREALQHAEWLVVTFGTAWVYRHHARGVVANCHRLPPSSFTRELLSPEEMVGGWCALVGRLRELNPKLRVMLTVSPVRHLRDGLRENSVSKGALHLEVHRLTTTLPELYYFPAYEILIDELRDYRFYAEDMAHPSPQAEQIVWDRLQKAWLTPIARENARRIGDFFALLHHRPRVPGSPADRAAIAQLTVQLEALRREFPSGQWDEAERMLGERKDACL